jgi:hypothetical protein
MVHRFHPGVERLPTVRGILLAVYIVLTRMRRCHHGGGDLVLRRLPGLPGAEKTLREVLAEQGVDTGVKLVAVNTDEEAQRLRFPGSPTIGVDGEDLFPIPDRAEYAIGCRMYAAPEGLRGSPTAEMLSKALTNL